MLSLLFIIVVTHHFLPKSAWPIYPGNSLYFTRFFFCFEFSFECIISFVSFNSGMPSKSQLYLPHASSVVRWVGRLVSNVQLSARSSHSIFLRAAIPGPGTYNLGAHLQVFCSLSGVPDKEAVLQRMRVESAIVVSETIQENSNYSSGRGHSVVVAS